MDCIRVRGRRSTWDLGLSELEGDDGGSMYEECFAAMGGESVLDEVEEAARR
jgi:hypothetical protein